MDRHLADSTSILGSPHDPKVIAERLNLALSAGGLGDWSWDAHTDIVTVSRRCAEVFGIPHQPITWTRMRELLHPDDRERARLAVEQSITDRVPYNIEYRVNRPEGDSSWIAARGCGTYADDGSVVGMVGVVQDITERKLTESAQREEAQVLEALNRTAIALASTLDTQSLLQMVTDAATQVCGAQFGAFFYNAYDEQGGVFQLYVLSGAPREAFAKFGHPRATPMFAPTFKGEGIIRLDDVLADPRYGQWAPHRGMPQGHLPVRSYLAVPVRSRTDEVLGGLFFGHPETGRFTARAERLVTGIAAHAAAAIDNARLYETATRARAQAELASKQKDEFLATLSHELRTPLTAILGWTQVLRRDPDKSGRTLQQGLEIIERNTRLQAQLIEDLLDMSRIASGKLQLDIQTIMPSTTILAAVETVRHAADAKNIRLVTALDHAAGPIAGDPRRLQQVLWNLLSNAIKFTPTDGCVQVELTAHPSHIEIAVTDNGIGMRPDLLPYVFERFWQDDASTTRRYGGLGLGLSIVKQLVELHGGTAHAHSAGENQGATFTLRLPVEHHAVQSAAPVPMASSTKLEMPDLTGLQVLVVDDEQDARALVERVLSDCGASVILAENSVHALSVLEQSVPDVIISDIGMPDVDGYEFIRRARASMHKSGRRAPAIAMTAFARSEDRTRALQAGFLAHIAKPVDSTELAATVATVAGRNFS